jgi:hypothetical protein
MGPIIGTTLNNKFELLMVTRGYSYHKELLPQLEVKEYYASSIRALTNWVYLPVFPRSSLSLRHDSPPTWTLHPFLGG